MVTRMQASQLASRGIICLNLEHDTNRVDVINQKIKYSPSYP